MEENYHYPSDEINSADFNKILHSNVCYLSKKRKLHAEQLGLPLPKHRFCNRSFASKNDFPSNANLEAEDFHECTFKTENVGRVKYDGSELESAKDSNSFSGDVDTLSTASNGVQIKMQYPTTFLDDLPSSSSASQSGDCFKNILYSLDSRSLTNSSGDKGKLPCGGEENSPTYRDFGFDSPLNCEEHLMELGKDGDFSYSEYAESSEQYTDKELEDILFSNGLNPNDYVLSSGRWNVNQENLPDKKKLTIDKEFEQYFSMLMLQ